MSIFTNIRPLCANTCASFRLQTLVYLEDWKAILREFDRETLLTIQQNYAAQEMYEVCQEIELAL